MYLAAYRSDIDGLRALAVFSVIGYHAFPKQFPGGFVGVDIFFVISGYLISGLIYEALERGTFSFVDFYARRARRIFPALIAVLVACVIAGWFVMLQEEYRSLGKTVGAAAAFVANFAFLHDAGYFGPASDAVPLLHLWSLGVEEQYYLLWPLLVVLSWRFTRAPLALACVVFVASFAANVALVRTDATAAFFLPQTRFWELMLGSGVAFAKFRETDINFASSRPSRLRELYRRHTTALHEMAAWGGLGLIAAALAMIDGSKLFPGWWALLPTLGATLLIIAGPTASINRRLLSHRVAVYIGLISYPLYLWHWPILVFEGLIRIKPPTDLIRLACVVVAFIVADGTYRWIEKPIRSGGSLRPKAMAAAIALAASGCLGLLIYLEHGFPERLPEEVRALGDGQLTDGGAFAFARPENCLVIREGVHKFGPECDGPDGKPKVVLWGDSHAAHLSFGLRILEQTRADFSPAEYAVGGCPPIISYVSEQVPDCRSINDFVIARIAALRPVTVILAAQWKLYDGRDRWSEISATTIRATAERLVAMGVRRIVVVGQFPIWQTNVPRIRVALFRASINDPSLDPSRTTPEEFASELAADKMVQRAIEGTGAIYVSPLSQLCDGTGCLLVVPGSNKSISPDNGHLTRDGSEYFARSNADALLGK